MRTVRRAVGGMIQKSLHYVDLYIIKSGPSANGGILYGHIHVVQHNVCVCCTLDTNAALKPLHARLLA